MTTISTAYENLVKQIHEGLLVADGVDSIDVRHNVKIIGRSGASHQVDVYWEFRLAGVTYKTCIECKHYSAKVKKSHIAAFAAILDDIGNATGIFATTVGFQEGALLFAKSKGVRLLLVNHLLKTVAITSHITAPSTDITSIRYNKAQASKCLVALGLQSFSLLTSWDPNTQFFDEGGNPKITFRQLFKDKAQSEGKFTLVKPGIFDLTEIGLIEVEEIEYQVHIFRDVSTMEFSVNETQKAIVEDVLQNTSCYLNDDGTVTKFVPGGMAEPHPEA